MSRAQHGVDGTGLSAHVLQIYDLIRTSFWFVPSVMALAAVVLAAVLVFVDTFIKVDPEGPLFWLAAGDVESVRTMLSAIVSSIITVISVVFSITIVALTLASSQFGPRLLRNFMQDTGNQIVLGILIATFVYCLLLLQAVGRLGAISVPQVSALGGFFLALVSIGALIYFIHHIARSIQASAIIANVSEELDFLIDRVWPEPSTAKPERTQEQRLHAEAELVKTMQLDALPIPSPSSDFIQAIDYDDLTQIARRHDAVLDLPFRPGDFVIEGAPLMKVRTREGVPAQFADHVCRHVALGPIRTETQDPEFAVDQLSELAMRALSPGINDPRTAMICVDRLTAALCRVAGRRMHGPNIYDEEGTIRMVVDAVSFGELIDASFDPIRHAGSTQPMVLASLAGALLRLAEVVPDDTLHRDPIRAHAGAVRRVAEGAGFDEKDHATVTKRMACLPKWVEG